MKKLVTFLLLSIFCLSYASAQMMGEPMGGLKGKILTESSEVDEEVKPMSIGGEQEVQVEFLDEETEKQIFEKRRAAAAGEVSALYSFPDGYYIMGLSDFGTKYREKVVHIYGPAYYVEGAYWKNLSQNADSYVWENMVTTEYAFNSTGEMYEPSEEFEPQARVYPMDIYGVGYPSPTLIAKSGSEEDDYIFGKESVYNEAVAGDYEYGYMYLGGKPEGVAYNQQVSYGITNLDHYNFEYQTTRILDAKDSERNFYFGSNSGTGSLNSEGNYYTFEACGEVFAKPLQPYILDHIRIALTRSLIAEGTELEIFIHRFKDGQPTDTIARCYWLAEEDDDQEDLDQIRYFGFRDFIVKDENGQEQNRSWVIISDEILVEFKGYNDADGLSQIAVADQAGISWNGKSTAYFYQVGHNADGTVTSERWVSTLSTALKERSLGIFLDVTYSYLVPTYGTEAKVEFPLEGGSKVVPIHSYYLPVNYETDENGNVLYEEIVIAEGLKAAIPFIKEITDGIVMFDNVPDWLTIEITDVYNRMPYREITYLTFTAEPATAGRGATPLVFNLGAEQIFEVVQGEYSSIGENRVSEVKVTKLDDSFNIVCSNDFSSVAIYNISGQKVYEGAVQGGGATTISATGFEKGIYIFKFAGNKTETVKVLN